MHRRRSLSSSPRRYPAAWRVASPRQSRWSRPPRWPTTAPSGLPGAGLRVPVRWQRQLQHHRADGLAHYDDLQSRRARRWRSAHGGHAGADPLTPTMAPGRFARRTAERRRELRPASAMPELRTLFIDSARDHRQCRPLAVARSRRRNTGRRRMRCRRNCSRIDDQANFWQTSRADDASANGWGGRIADLLHTPTRTAVLSHDMSLSGQASSSAAAPSTSTSMAPAKGVEASSYLDPYQNANSASQTHSTALHEHGVRRRTCSSAPTPRDAPLDQDLHDLG